MNKMCSPLQKQTGIYWEFSIIHGKYLKTLVRTTYCPATPHWPLIPKLISPSSLSLLVLGSYKINGEPLSTSHTSLIPAQNMFLVMTRCCFSYVSAHFWRLTTDKLVLSIKSLFPSSQPKT